METGWIVDDLDEMLGLSKEFEIDAHAPVIDAAFVEKWVPITAGWYKTNQTVVDDRLCKSNWEIKAVTVGIVLVAAGILVVVGVLVVTYKLISRLPRDDESRNGGENAG